ncbi:MAG: hypothetical protein WD904_07965 [Dehalococcoidia bacterium]
MKAKTVTSPLETGFDATPAFYGGAAGESASIWEHELQFAHSKTWKLRET